MEGWGEVGRCSGERLGCGGWEKVGGVVGEVRTEKLYVVVG